MANCLVKGCAMKVLYSRGLCYGCYTFAYNLVRKRLTTWVLLERMGKVSKKTQQDYTKRERTHALTTARRLWFYDALKEQMAKAQKNGTAMVQCALCCTLQPSNPCKECLQGFDDIERSIED